MAYKVFSNGNTLPASDLNTYLMNQSVITFASTSARDAAIPAPNEGMLVWLEDSNKYVKYNGTGWADLVDPIPSGNAIINGAFDIWQRGTSSSSTLYCADRWFLGHDVNPTTFTQSRQTFTPGAAPVAGYEGQYFYRYAITTVGSGSNAYINQAIEDVRTFAGQTVTVSFWAKADSARTIQTAFNQNFGSGGSTTVGTSGVNHSVTTSWTRFTATYTLPSISGKTVGTSSYLQFYFTVGSLASGLQLDIWGVQLESGSTATPFKRNAPSIGAEEIACYRYLPVIKAGSAYMPFGDGYATSTTSSRIFVPFQSPTRTSSTTVEWAGSLMLFDGTTSHAVTTLTVSETSPYGVFLAVGVSSGLTNYRPYALVANNDTTAYIRFPREL
jgi:hypothetical protein